MVIYDLNGMNIALIPHKADSPLIVDADAVLPFAIFQKNLQIIAGQQGEIAQRSGRIEDNQFFVSRPLDIFRELLRKLPAKNLFGFLAAKCSNHGSIYTVYRYMSTTLTFVSHLPQAGCFAILGLSTPSTAGTGSPLDLTAWMTIAYIEYVASCLASSCTMNSASSGLPMRIP